MKKILIFLSIIMLSISCSSDSDFEKGKKQLEQQGYTNIENTGHKWFCCDKNDGWSTGFKCKNNKGEVVEGCFCSAAFKGVTIRFD